MLILILEVVVPPMCQFRDDVVHYTVLDNFGIFLFMLYSENHEMFELRSDCGRKQLALQDTFIIIQFDHSIQWRFAIKLM